MPEFNSRQRSNPTLELSSCYSATCHSVEPPERLGFARWVCRACSLPLCWHSRLQRYEAASAARVASAPAATKVQLYGPVTSTHPRVCKCLWRPLFPKTHSQNTHTHTHAHMRARARAVEHIKTFPARLVNQPRPSSVGFAPRAGSRMGPGNEDGAGVASPPPRSAPHVDRGRMAPREIQRRGHTITRQSHTTPL